METSMVIVVMAYGLVSFAAGMILAKVIFIKKGKSVSTRNEVVIDFKVNSKDAEKDIQKLIVRLSELKEQIPNVKNS